MDFYLITCLLARISRSNPRNPDRETATMQDRQLGELMEAIEAYLACHPEAVDSEEGIARWWLRSRGLEATAEDVRTALQRLIAFRTVRVTHTPDGRSVYGAAPRPPPDRAH